MQPKTPANLSKYARTCLVALAEQNFGAAISLGGAVGLAYYFEYRETHDVDAWWDDSVNPDQRRAVVHCLESALARFGEVRTRAWGEVVSVELLEARRAVFSFQIAQRGGLLEQPQSAPWPKGLRLDAFEDLVAAKMAALVERGAPRDFRDIHALVEAGLIDSTSCWSLWRRRQELTGGDASAARARLAIETHLARIESHRPLDAIGDAAGRERAGAVRTWFREVFLNALVD